MQLDFACFCVALATCSRPSSMQVSRLRRGQDLRFLGLKVRLHSRNRCSHHQMSTASKTDECSTSKQLLSLAIMIARSLHVHGKLLSMGTDGCTCKYC